MDSKVKIITTPDRIVFSTEEVQDILKAHINKVTGRTVAKHLPFISRDHNFTFDLQPQLSLTAQIPELKKPLVRTRNLLDIPAYVGHQGDICGVNNDMFGETAIMRSQGVPGGNPK